MSGVQIGKKGNMKVFASCLIVGIFFTIWFCISYFQLPMGDDILYQFKYGASWYMDQPPVPVGEHITNLRGVFENSCYTYLYWSGRIIGYALLPLISLWGLGFVAVLSALINETVILIIMRLIYKEEKLTKAFLQHPAILVLTHVLVFAFGRYMDYLSMWTFTSIYTISVLLFLAILFKTQKAEKSRFEISAKDILQLNILGFFMGISHEVYGAILILILGIKFILRLKKGNILRYLMSYLGLGIGYLICFFAPGNIVRMNSAHDADINNPISQKFMTSLLNHIYVGTGEKYLVCLLSVFVILCVTFALLIKSIHLLPFIKSILADNYEYIIGAIFSIFIWMASSYVPSYGILLFMCFYTIVLCDIILKISSKNRNIVVLNSYMSGIVMLCVVVWYLSWIPNLISSTIEIRQQIKTGLSSGNAEIVVMKYPDEIDNVYTFHNYRNNGYSDEVDIKYWGKPLVFK